MVEIVEEVGRGNWVKLSEVEPKTWFGCPFCKWLKLLRNFLQARTVPKGGGNFPWCKLDRRRQIGSICAKIS